MEARSLAFAVLVGVVVGLIAGGIAALVGLDSDTSMILTPIVGVVTGILAVSRRRNPGSRER